MITSTITTSPMPTSHNRAGDCHAGLLVSSVYDLDRFPWLRCFLLRGLSPRRSVGSRLLDLAKSLGQPVQAWHLGVGFGARRF